MNKENIMKTIDGELYYYYDYVYWIYDEMKRLQEENEKLKELCDKYEEEHNNEFKIWKDERQQLLDYKSRNEKAIEYIKEKYNCELFQNKKLLNILQGEDTKESEVK